MPNHTGIISFFFCFDYKYSCKMNSQLQFVKGCQLINSMPLSPKIYSIYWTFWLAVICDCDWNFDLDFSTIFTNSDGLNWTFHAFFVFGFDFVILSWLAPMQNKNVHILSNKLSSLFIFDSLYWTIYCSIFSSKLMSMFCSIINLSISGRDLNWVNPVAIFQKPKFHIIYNLKCKINIQFDFSFYSWFYFAFKWRRNMLHDMNIHWNTLFGFFSYGQYIEIKYRMFGVKCNRLKAFCVRILSRFRMWRQ